MPGTFLTAKDRDRLAGFPEDIPHWDLITYFTLTEQDAALMATYHTDAHRVGVALQLCTVRYLGFCPTSLQTAPEELLASLATQLHVDPDALHRYGQRRMTRSAHFQAVLRYLNVRRVQPADHKPILT
jgi:uncharacterized protein DUF4158